MAGRKRTRTDYLNLAADKVAKAAWAATRSLGRETDLRTLKETEAVLKEAVGVALSLEKSASDAPVELRVIFEDGTEALSE